MTHQRCPGYFSDARELDAQYSQNTRTQIAALFGTAILTVLPATQFSGMLTPVAIERSTN